MEVILDNVAKHYGREQVIHSLGTTLASGSRTALLGANGSGKSTLLQLMGGVLVPTHGTVTHVIGGKPVDPQEVYRHISIAAPYLSLYEDLTLEQAITFHARFKPLRGAKGAREVAAIARLEHALEKSVSQFSSGMKQRLKLALAILSDTPLLLLDEPASNLDTDAIAWYRALLQEHATGRTIVIASNRQTAEHDLCTAVIEVERHKGAIG